MGKTIYKDDVGKKSGRWFQVFWIIPLLFIIMILIGAVTGLVKVNSHHYFYHGLTRIALSTLAGQLNVTLILGLRLLIPLIFMAICFFIYHKNMKKAAVSTFGVGVLWIAALLGVFAFIKQETGGVDLHRVPDFLAKALTLEGFFEKHFINKIEIAKMFLMPFRHPLNFLSILVIAIPFGLFFEKFVKFNFFTKGIRRSGKLGVALFWLFFAVSVIFATVLNAANYAVSTKGALPQPNIILISIDTLRQDALGAYGGVNVNTPNLDALAGQGAVFENAYSLSPWTLPGHAAILTGFSPTHLGIRKVEDRLSKRVLTLPEILSNYGYATAAVTSYILVSPAYGFDQGFDRFIYNRDLNATQIMTIASAYVKNSEKAPFFLFLHLYDPHWPYHPSAELAREFYPGEPTKEMYDLFKTKNYYDWVVKAINGPAELIDFSRKMYDAEVSGVDKALGALLDTVRDQGIEGRTVIIITSDHGEEFNEHGLMGHGLTLYNEALRVPLIVKFPTLIPEGSRIKMEVQAIDIFPTILAMAGIQSPLANIEGKDLTSEVYLRGKEDKREFIAETAMSGDVRFATIEDGFKYITPFELHFGKTLISHQAELYNLENDMEEQGDLSDRMPTMLKHMKQVLSDGLRRIEKERIDSGAHGTSSAKELSSEEIERLRSLGYIQ